jgi:hypothetical protein
MQDVLQKYYIVKRRCILPQLKVRKAGQYNIERLDEHSSYVPTLRTHAFQRAVAMPARLFLNLRNEFFYSDAFLLQLLLKIK